MGFRAILLAGGKGTRLKPYTALIPKPIVPVGDKAIMEIVVQRLIACGCERITVADTVKQALAVGGTAASSAVAAGNAGIPACGCAPDHGRGKESATVPPDKFAPPDYTGKPS